MNPIKKFLISQFIPQHSNHMTQSSDLEINWDYCKNYYKDFSLHLIEFNRIDNRTSLPSKALFKKIFINYLTDNSNASHFFKTQWVLSEYITNGWKYPVQAVWNWRLRWWEIHPGYLRGLIYNLFEVEDWLAWYQPMKNRNVVTKEKFKSPQEIYNYFEGCHHISTHVVNYFQKPLMTICVHVSQNQDSIELHKNIFYKNIENGINIVGDTNTIEKVMKEVDQWPEGYIKNQIIYNNESLPSLTITKFNKDNFYAGLYLFGTKVTNLEKIDLIYRNKK